MTAARPSHNAIPTPTFSAHSCAGPTVAMPTVNLLPQHHLADLLDCLTAMVDNYCAPTAGVGGRLLFNGVWVRCVPPAV